VIIREFCYSSGKEVVEKTNQNTTYRTNFDSGKDPAKLRN
jgi:hypothetical protein